MPQPGLGAVARMQEGERGADRQAVVPHRGKYEHLVQRQGFGKQPVEPHVGEQAAGQRELARAGAREPPAHRLHGVILGDFLDRGRDGLAVVPLADRQEFLAHRGPVAEIGLHQSRLGIEPKLRRHLARQLRLAVSRKPRELSLMAQHAEAARDRRVAIGAGEARLLQRPGQPAVVAVMALELAALQAAHRIADIVADAVGRINERVVPVGVEQRRERMRLVVIGEMDLRVRPERIVLQETVRAEQLVRVGDAEAMAQHRELAVGALAPAPALKRVVQLAPEREFVVVRREPAARGGDRVDIVAPPVSDPQHLVDRKPRHALARALHAGEALLRHRRDHLVVVERGGGRIVHAGMDRQDTQRGHLLVWGGFRLAREPITPNKSAG